MASVDPASQTTACVPAQVLISKNEAVAGRVVGHVRGLEAEVDVLKHLDHPNIVRYLARPVAVGWGWWSRRRPGQEVQRMAEATSVLSLAASCAAHAWKSKTHAHCMSKQPNSAAGLHLVPFCAGSQ